MSNTVNLVDTEELKECLGEGFTPESTMKCYDISKNDYDRIINSKANISVKMGKDSPLWENEE